MIVAKRGPKVLRPRALPGRTTPPGQVGGGVLTLVWVAGLLLTLLVGVWGERAAAEYAPDLHLVVDTVDGLIAAVVCALLVARAARTRRRGDRLLAEAFGVLAVASLVLSVGAELAHVAPEVATWSQVTARSGAVVMLLPAVLDRRRASGRWRPLPGLSVLVVALAFGVLVGPSRVPVRVRVEAGELVVQTDLLLTVLIAVSAGLSLATALVLDHRQRRGEAILAGWLAPALVLLALARVHYLLFPSLYSGFVFSGDLLRTAGYVVLLVGAVLEVVDHWSSESRAAVAEERRRLARELHDGAVQEITLARLDVLGLSDRADGRTAEDVVESLDLALAELRWVMSDLVRRDEPLDALVSGEARALGQRLGLRVDLDVEPVPSTAQERHEVSRIVREAMLNAARHGAARRVEVSLSRRGTRHVLRLRDDGSGLEPAIPGHGHGLVSMRERARELGGRLDVNPVPGGGTEVEVTW